MTAVLVLAIGVVYAVWKITEAPHLRDENPCETRGFNTVSETRH